MTAPTEAMNRIVAALSGPAWGKGLRPRPAPTDADVAAATAFVDSAFTDKCPVWFANNRAGLIRSQTFTERDARVRREDREGRHDRVWLEEAE